MKKLFAKVENLLSAFTDSDGQIKYCASLDGNIIVIVPSTGYNSFSSAVISSLLELKVNLSEYLDCSFYIDCCGGFPRINFYIDTL